MERQRNLLLYDILQAIKDIESFLGGKRIFSEYQRSLILKRAIEREFEIIGEAVKRLMSIQPDLKITGAKRIISFRNRISHGYDAIDDEAVWGIIVNHLPALKLEIEEMLN